MPRDFQACEVLPIDLDSFYRVFIEKPDFQIRFNQSRGDQNINVSEWQEVSEDATGKGIAPRLRRTITFQTPLKGLPTAVSKLIGVDSTGIEDIEELMWKNKDEFNIHASLRFTGSMPMKESFEMSAEWNFKRQMSDSTTMAEPATVATIKGHIAFSGWGRGMIEAAMEKQNLQSFIDWLAMAKVEVQNWKQQEQQRQQQQLLEQQKLATIMEKQERILATQRQQQRMNKREVASAPSSPTPKSSVSLSSPSSRPSTPGIRNGRRRSRSTSSSSQRSDRSSSSDVFSDALSTTSSGDTFHDALSDSETATSTTTTTSASGSGLRQQRRKFTINGAASIDFEEEEDEYEEAEEEEEEEEDDDNDDNGGGSSMFGLIKRSYSLGSLKEELGNVRAMVAKTEARVVSLEHECADRKLEMTVERYLERVEQIHAQQAKILDELRNKETAFQSKLDEIKRQFDAICEVATTTTTTSSSSSSKNNKKLTVVEQLQLQHQRKKASSSLWVRFWTFVRGGNNNNNKASFTTGFIAGATILAPIMTAAPLVALYYILVRTPGGRAAIQRALFPHSGGAPTTTPEVTPLRFVKWVFSSVLQSVSWL